MSLKSWKEIPIGGLIVEAGNSVEYETGSWRTLCPKIDMDKCVHCMICWMFCPDSSMLVENGRLKGVDVAHCKGCGICAQECPRKAITMEKETTSKGAA